MHALQDYTSVAEAQEIMSVPMQMVTPQSNSVLIALVQDSIVGAYMLSRRDALLTHEQAAQLVMAIHYDAHDAAYAEMPGRAPASFADAVARNGGLPAPAILKGTSRTRDGSVARQHGPRWTGKQIVSWMLPPALHLTKAPSGASAAKTKDIMDDKVALVRGGELLAGRLCKASVGMAAGGIVHTLWKTVGPWAAAKFVSDAQRVTMAWLRRDTVCISIRDCITPCDAAVDAITAEAMAKAADIAASDVPPEVKEVRSAGVLQETLRNVGAAVLAGMDAGSGIATVVASGSKGNLMNIAQIAGLVGQQTVNGTRIPFRKGPRGPRTLACFAPGDNSPEARGFVATSYLMGLQPAEFFFHQQAGREGVVATAVSTADSGYNQRRMVKNQESEVVAYDLSVRGSSNLIVQLHYGGDDYDGTRLERVKLGVLEAPDAEAALQMLLGSDGSADTAEVARLVEAWTALRDVTHAGTVYGGEASSSVPMPANLGRVVAAYKVGAAGGGGAAASNAPADASRLLCRLLRAVHDAHGVAAASFGPDAPLDELLFWRGRDWLSCDDASRAARLVLALQCTSVAVTRWGLSADDEGALARAFARQYAAGIVHPGEGVGAVGSTSIGEPSTQLTLNSIEYGTRITWQEGGVTRTEPIGPWIDELIDDALASDDPTLQRHPHNTYWWPLPPAWHARISSVDTAGKITWRAIEAVTRHPPINADGSCVLLRVRTRSGREVTATKAKSFLVRRNNKVVELAGEELAVGERLPVVCRDPRVNLELIDALDVRAYLPESEWNYSGIWAEAASIFRSGGAKPRWWPAFAGRLPYTRSDSARRSITVDHAWIAALDADYVFPATPRGVEAQRVPARIALDWDFGFFLGAYLADGCCSEHQVVIAKEDAEYRGAITALMDRWGLGYRTVADVRDGSDGGIAGTSTSVRVHSTTLAALLPRMCGSLAAGKRVPAWVVSAPTDFVASVVSGYISGDGSVDTKGDTVGATSSSQQLIEGMAQLCACLGVHALSRGPFKTPPTTACAAPADRFELRIRNGDTNRAAALLRLVGNGKAEKLAAITPKALEHSMADFIPGVACAGLPPSIKRENARAKLRAHDAGAALLSADAQAALRAVTEEDVIWDEVTAVEEVLSPHPWVYDLTVEGTRNFTLSNGLCVRDTFHYAGIAEKNVTLTGLPRFKQIINAVDTAETSNMRIALAPAALGDSADAHKYNARAFASRLAKTLLSKLVKSSRVVPAAAYDPEDPVIDATGLSLALDALTAETSNYAVGGGAAGAVPKGGARRATDACVAAALAAAMDGISGSSGSSGGVSGGVSGSSGGVSGSSGVSAVSGSSEGVSGGTSTGPSAAASAASAALRRRGPTRRTVTPATRLGTWVAVYELDKAACYSRYLGVEDVGAALAAFLGGEAQVSWCARWAERWLVLVRPPAWGEDVRLDRPVADAVHDALLEHAVVNGISGVIKAVPSRDPLGGGTWGVETEGSDLLALAQLVHVDPLHTTTNNIQEVARLLGVEAAVCLTQAELHRVLSFDGSYVDPRHTWLLADTVARAGCINPLNRHKMEELGGSLLQCASFEQTLDVFEQGAAFGKSDTLGGATEKLIVGQPVHVGTGSFGLLVPEVCGGGGGGGNGGAGGAPARATFVAPLAAEDVAEDAYLAQSVFVQPLAKRPRPHHGRVDDNDSGDDGIAALPRHGRHAPQSSALGRRSQSLQSSQSLQPLASARGAAAAAAAAAAASRIFVPPPNLLGGSSLAASAGAGMASLFAVMRKHAQKRIPVWVSCDVVPVLDGGEGDDAAEDVSSTASLNAAEYGDIEAAMDAYRGWAECPAYLQVTEVHYTLHDKPVVSRVSFVDGGVHAQHEVTSIQEVAATPMPAPLDAWALRGRAYTRQPVSAATLPASVVPTSVRICHNKAFVKGSWTATLTRAWRGRNNLEAEALQRGGSATASFHLRIELTAPWELMEERGSTNSAMAASMVQRANACLACIGDDVASA